MLYLDGLPSSSRSTFSLIATYQGYRFNASPPVFSTPHFAHLSSIIFRTKLSTGLARRLVVTRGKWCPHTPRVTPTRVCLQITGPLNMKLIFFRMNPIQFVFYLGTGGSTSATDSGAPTVSSSHFSPAFGLSLALTAHRWSLRKQMNVKVIRERKTSHLFIVLILFPPYELINWRQFAFEIIFSL